MARTRFTIDAKGRPCRVISVDESKSSGDLTIGIPTGRFTATQYIPFVQRPDIIVTEKYSIHMSHASVTGISVMHHTQILLNRPPVKSRHHTSVIKSGTNFATVFGRMAPHPNFAPRYTLTKIGGSRFSLGSYDPDCFTLLFMVIIAAKDNIFACNHPDIQIQQIAFRQVRLILLWQFMTCGAIPHGFFRHYSTTKEDAKLPEWSPIDGQSAEECVDSFRNFREAARDDLFRHARPRLKKIFGGTGLIASKRLKRRAEFVRDGDQ